MPEHYSTQITKINSVPIQFLPAIDQGGRVRIAFFEFTTPATGVAINDTIQLCKVPKGSRILGGAFANEAMSTAGGAAGVSLGDGTTADKYLAETSVDAASTDLVWFAKTIAKNFGETLAAELTLTATALTEAWAAAKKLWGFVLYALD